MNAIAIAPDEEAVESGGSRHHAALSLASHLLSTLHDENELFQRLVEILARELNSRRVSLMRVNREAGVLEMRAAVGIPQEVFALARPRIGEGIAGTCAAIGRPLFIDDHRRARGGSDLRAFLPEGMEGRNLPMSLTVPILVRGEVVGVVNVTDRADFEPYSGADITFISSVMAHAGHLFENAALMSHLASLRAFNERVLDTLADPLVVVDAEARVVSTNHRFDELFGGEPGLLLWEILPLEPMQRDLLCVAMQAAPEALPADALESWALAERLFDLQVTPFQDAGRQRQLVFLRDVTSRRQMERRLLAAEKMASLGVLAAGVAHEINNPIAFIKANARHTAEYFADLLGLLDQWRGVAAHLPPDAVATLHRAETALDLPNLREDIQLMVKETMVGIERVERIVAGLKSFAHPDTERTREAELVPLLENAILLTQGQWKYKLEIIRDFADAPTIWCLPNQLEQVFMNLIVNAAQAAREWGHLKVVARPSEDGVALRFEDDCGGIPPGIVDRIFEPFFTTKDIGEGTGLGLAISYNIIESHGGRLRVETEHGRGTAFVIELPGGAAGRPLVVKQQSRFRT